MGNCCCPSDDKGFQINDPDERTRLLGNPVSNNVSRPVTSDSFPSPQNHASQRGDEQSALNRILHQTASNVIDVAAIDARSMEQHEYLDKARQYSSKLTMLCNKTPIPSRPHSLPSGVGNPHAILSAPPLSQADIQFITQVADRTAQTLKEIKVKHKEDLVVPFGVP
ncbi:ragulator complex protein LAMTOR1-like isoform X4 [Lingula anatina]|uniref:Ragulator complex protein LAMTOR1 n=1 Tax=Lingula anatina TaxID=7574 RepID=A0A1S3H458_LINAN|nr:ragulator complex protein LAMTOR1-like isoform X4 [Lingula anatina]|eukprot:XP_013380251.1 ragulator complex protein LAMTOR1-like isoform X4 [Lingula anatina]